MWRRLRVINSKQASYQLKLIQCRPARMRLRRRMKCVCKERRKFAALKVTVKEQYTLSLILVFLTRLLPSPGSIRDWYKVNCKNSKRRSKSFSITTSWTSKENPYLRMMFILSYMRTTHFSIWSWQGFQESLSVLLMIHSIRLKDQSTSQRST